MGGATDAIQNRIPQIQVGRRHVDLGAQHVATVLELSVSHALEQVEILFDAACTKRAVLALFVIVTALFANRLQRLAIHVGLARFHQLDGIVVEL